MRPSRRTAPYAGDVVGGADVLGEQSIADLPGEDGRTLSLVVRDTTDHVGRRHARLTAADRPRSDGPALVVTTQYLAHAPVRYLDASHNLL